MAASLRDVPQGPQARRWRLAVVSSHAVQFMAPWYRYLAADSRLDVTVLYGSDHGLRPGYDPEFGQLVQWDVDLESGYRWQILRSAALRPGVGRFFGVVSADPLWLLSRQHFDAVLIQGWNYALFPLALMVARARGLPVLIRCESVERRPAPTLGAELREAARAALLRRYLGSCAAALAVSTGNRRLLLHYGVAAERIFWSPYAVDGGRFALGPAVREAARRRWRQQLGVAEATPVLLFVGKLVPVKAPQLLLSAYAALRASGVVAQLVICGDGRLRAELAAWVAAQGVPGVSFVGFVNQAELPGLYAAADALVLPSQRETFGMVVAEAMHSGLPAVVSDRVGCAADLVVDGVSGLTFPSGDGAALLGCLRELCGGAQAAARRAQLAAGARQRIASFTYAEATAGLVAALHSLG